MPVYEEKLISPFAIRFSQEHIRSTFRDGRELQESLASITTKPGDGQEYDLILCAPFPHIEIIRWSGKKHGHNGEPDKDSGGEHWFSFDNRRLFCLQRAAVAYWPRRVACVVEVLYKADKASWWRKYDTVTCGQVVSIRHFSLDVSMGTWDWNEAVARLTAKPGLPGEKQMSLTVAHVFASRCVNADAAKVSVESLRDAPRESSKDGTALACIARLAAASEVAKDSSDVHDGIDEIKRDDSDLPRCETPSTDVSEESVKESAKGCEGESYEELPGAPADSSDEDTVSWLQEIFDGCTWGGSKGDIYSFEPYDESSWTCVRVTGGKREYQAVYDWDFSVLWWGMDGTSNSWFFMDPTELFQKSDQINWYPKKDLEAEKRKPRFKWKKLGESQGKSLRKTQAQARSKPIQSEGLPRWLPKAGRT
jgi:hypothetical protein